MGRLVYRALFLVALIIVPMISMSDNTMTRQQYADALGLSLEDIPPRLFKIIQKNGSKTVMMSKTGRFIIKGEMIDLWDGVDQDSTAKAQFPTMPASFPLSDYTIQFGEPGNKQLFVVASYGCLKCKQVLTELLTKETIGKYHITILPVFNAKHEQTKLKQVFCAADRASAFRDVFVERKDIAVSEHCDTKVFLANNKLAEGFGVATLPTTFVEGTNVAYYGTVKLY